MPAVRTLVMSFITLNNETTLVQLRADLIRNVAVRLSGNPAFFFLSLFLSSCHTTSVAALQNAGKIHYFSRCQRAKGKPKQKAALTSFSQRKSFYLAQGRMSHVRAGTASKVTGDLRGISANPLRVRSAPGDELANRCDGRTPVLFQKVLPESLAFR